MKMKLLARNEALSAAAARLTSLEQRKRLETEPVTKEAMRRLEAVMRNV